MKLSEKLKEGLNVSLEFLKNLEKMDHMKVRHEDIKEDIEFAESALRFIEDWEGLPRKQNEFSHLSLQELQLEYNKRTSKILDTMQDEV